MIALRFVSLLKRGPEEAVGEEMSGVCYEVTQVGEVDGGVCGGLTVSCRQLGFMTGLWAFIILLCSLYLYI